MRCLVTGGFGFLGSWVVDSLAGQGHEIFILSRSSEGRSFVAASKQGYVSKALPYSFIQADLAGISPEMLAEKLPGNLDAVIHAASCNDSFLPNYGKEALLANVLGTRNLLEAIAVKGGTFPLFIYISTFHVYGKDRGNVDETLPPTPRDDYGLTHFTAEEYCRMYYRKTGVPFIIARCTNGYGVPRCVPFGKWYLLFPDMCRQAFHRGEIFLRSSPDMRRDFIRMADLARIIAALAGRRDLAGHCYNIGSGVALPIGQVAHSMAHAASRILGKKVEVRMETSPMAHGGTGASLSVDTSAVTAATGIRPSDGFEEETASTLAFLKNFGEV